MPLQPTNLPTNITEKDLGHIGDSETVHSAINELTSVAGADRVGTADGSTVEEALATKADAAATGDAIDALTGRVDNAESAIDARPTTADLAASGGAGLIGTPDGTVADANRLTRTLLAADRVVAWDDFERDQADNTPLGAAPMGGTWTDRVSTIVYHGGRAASGRGSGNAAIATLDGVTASNVDIEADVWTGGLNFEHGVVARYVDPDNWIALVAARTQGSGTGSFGIGSGSCLAVKVGGVVTTNIRFASIGNTSDGSPIFPVRLVIDRAQVWAFVAGHRVASHSLTPTEAALATGSVGVMSTRSSGSQPSGLGRFIARRMSL